MPHSHALAPSSVLAGYFSPRTWPFWAFHIAVVTGIAVGGWSGRGALLAATSYYVRMTVLTAAYHRYFAHRSFKTSRWFQFLLALGAQSSAQKGVLWWAAHHRWHHKHSDTALDVHSAKQRGFWYSHIGWILGPDWDDTDESRVSDLARYPELKILDHRSVRLLPAAALAGLFYAFGGGFGLFWGFVVSTVLLWHGTFTINSLSHMFGRRRYATTDDSRNNWLLALITTGEGWHNNHHHFQSSARQGFRWWEVDTTYYVLKALAAVGLVWDLRAPPDKVLAATEDTAVLTAPAA